MIRNFEMDKMIPARVVLRVLEDHFPEGKRTEYSNPEGFGSHYIPNEELINVVSVVQDMINQV